MAKLTKEKKILQTNAKDEGNQEGQISKGMKANESNPGSGKGVRGRHTEKLSASKSNI